MSTSSYACALADWEELLAALEANQDDLSLVDPYSAHLRAELSNLRTALARQSALRAEMLQATQDVHCYVALGKDLTRRIRDWLRSQYGHRSEKLTEFGIKPIRRRHPPRVRPVSETAGHETPRNPTSR